MQEKFLTIRAAIDGVRSTGTDAPPELIEFLKQMFDYLQAPFARVVRGSGERYSFIK